MGFAPVARIVLAVALCILIGGEFPQSDFTHCVGVTPMAWAMVSHKIPQGLAAPPELVNALCESVLQGKCSKL